MLLPGCFKIDKTWSVTLLLQTLINEINSPVETKYFVLELESLIQFDTLNISNLVHRVSKKKFEVIKSLKVVFGFQIK